MKREIKKGLIVGIVASFVFGIFGITYAAWNDDVISGSSLTADGWNNLVTQVEGITAGSGKFISGTSTSDAVFNGGNVGIGTTSPSRELDVEGTTRLGSNLYVGENTSQSYVNARVISEDNTLKLGASRSSNGDGVYVGSETNASVNFLQNNSTSMIITNLNRFGIGNINPSAKVEIYSDIIPTGLPETNVESTLLLNNQSGGTALKFEDTNSFITFGAGGVGVDSLRFIGRYGGGTDVMTLLSSSGNVGIGTSVPSQKLVVGDDLGSLTGDNSIVIGKTTGNASMIIGSANNDWASLRYLGSNNRLQFSTNEDGVFHNETMTIAGGNVGVGVVSPTRELSVNGVIKGHSHIFSPDGVTEQSQIYSTNASSCDSGGVQIAVHGNSRLCFKDF